MNDIRLAIIGVGHLGAIHARLSRQLEGVTLTAIVDPSAANRDALAAELDVRAYADYRHVLDHIDAAIIATPSHTHHAVAHELLCRGIHSFVEKPLTLNVGDAADLLRTAETSGLVLQVGHVERFNPAFIAANESLPSPRYIEAARTGPFSCRSTDVGVVLDLMIHDIDLALSLVGEEVISVDALGDPVIGPNEDWAQARLTFAGGCIANLYASRVSWMTRRSMHVTCRDRMAEIDFGARQVKFMKIGDRVLAGLNLSQQSPAERLHLKEHLFEEYLPLTALPIREGNPLVEEQREFIAAVRDRGRVTVSGREGVAALDVAERILTSIAGHRSTRQVSGTPAGRESILRGPHWARTAVRRKAG